jgi:hypothetical protein
MPQQAKTQNQQNENIRQPLSREEAIRIARQSHERLRAQRMQGANKAQDSGQAAKPGASNPQHTNKAGTPDKRFDENRSSDNRPGGQVHAMRPGNSSPQPRTAPQQSMQRPSAPVRPAAPAPRQHREEQHVTKEGAPDKRFAENRGLPTQEKRRDSVGVHRTRTGAPDRRFLENQHLSARQAEIERAKLVLMGTETQE